MVSNARFSPWTRRVDARHRARHARNDAYGIVRWAEPLKLGIIRYMDIRTFHLHYIEGQTEEPWADALRRLCTYRHDGTLTDTARSGATSRALAAWTIWHESEGQETTTSLRGWAMWDGAEATPRTE